MGYAAVVTGASSGIGRALALELVDRGWDVGLAARRSDLLEDLAVELRRRRPGVRVMVRPLDVSDSAATREVISGLFAALGDVRLVIANAGVGGEETLADAERLIATNVVGLIATLETARGLWADAPAVSDPPRRLVGVSSVAGFRGLPVTPVYSASKAAVSTYLEGLRLQCVPCGIGVVDIAPGFVDTPMSRSNPSRPFCISAEAAASQMCDRIERGAHLAVVPLLPWRLLRAPLRWVPSRVWTVLAARASARLQPRRPSR